MDNNLFYNAGDSSCSDDGMSDMDTMPVVGMAYVPMQQLKTMYEPGDGFVRGTVFPDLDKPWMPKGCVK